MPTVITRGGMSAQGFGFGAVASKLYVEDVFSTWLYTGNSSTQTITNGIDLSGKGGLVWIKDRTVANVHVLFDTNRGATNALTSNDTSANTVRSSVLTSFTSSGFTLGAGGVANQNTAPYASWTFRKAPKFFDVVTYTGDGSATRAIPHNLKIIPGAFIIKRTDASGSWYYANNIGDYTGVGPGTFNPLFLNSTSAAGAFDQSYSLGADATDFYARSNTNVNGATYVAYLFAHDATADGIIQCGSFTTNGSGAWSVNLGWEPQWVLMKRADNTGSWTINDNMRGIPTGGTDPVLWANLSNAELDASNYLDLTATGFGESSGNLGTSATYIYIAIRRGPMKTPTVGTSVFAPVTYTGNESTNSITTSFPVDGFIGAARSGSYYFWFSDRLRGATGLRTQLTNAEVASTISFASNTATVLTGADTANALSLSYVGWNFRRAPGFFDVVCYTGTGGSPSIQTINHNLGVTPELILLKARSATSYWYSNVPGDVANAFLEFPGYAGRYVGGQNWALTSTTFKPAGDTGMYLSGTTYVAYLFASCPGVSKVGSYTGNGSSQTINCGFSNGARFFLVKRTDSTGDWWVWDSARGITAPADPALRLNSTAAEVTSADATDPDNSGIIVNQEATCNINVNGATYIYLSVA